MKRGVDGEKIWRTSIFKSNQEHQNPKINRALTTAIKSLPVTVDVVQVDVRDLRRGLVQELDAVKRQRVLLILGSSLPVAGLIHLVLQVRGHERSLQQVLPLVVGALNL